MYASCTIFFPFACDYIIVAVCFSCDKTYSFVAFDLMAMWTVEDIKKEIADINAFLGHRKAGGQINDLETSMQKGILAKIDAVSLSPADSLLLYKQIDESSSFSTAMKNTLKEQVDQTLTKPTQTQGPQVTLKPQTISLPKYLTKEEWNIVLTGQNYHEKVNTLVGRLVQLGLKSLSEKSVKSATACLFCSLSTLPDALAKYQMVQDVKLAFTSKACTGSDMPFILTYPEEPDTLSPVVLAKAYSGGTSPSGFVPPEYSKMLHMVILRDTHKEIRKAKAQANTPAPAPTQPQSQPQPENNRALDMHMVILRKVLNLLWAMVRLGLPHRLPSKLLYLFRIFSPLNPSSGVASLLKIHPSRNPLSNPRQRPALELSSPCHSRVRLSSQMASMLKRLPLLL